MALFVPVSVLDLAPVPAGATPADALRNTLDLARHAEAWGYRRFWLAEHHNMAGIASAATAVVIAHFAGGTRTIRVGAGGIMLPNHAPLVIAEQFGTLESIHPGRIDLGVGRAPGTDQRTLFALRRTPLSADTFPQDVLELQAYLSGSRDTNTPVAPETAPSRAGMREPALTGQGVEAQARERFAAGGAAKPIGVEAVPGSGTNVPIWILGSSLFGAELAAELGLPYAFASHFAPAALLPAIARYRRHFRPSRQLDRPYVMAGVNVVAADTDEEATRLFTSAQQAFTHAVRGTRGQLPPPIDDIDRYWTPTEKTQVSAMLSVSFVGASRSVRHGLANFVDRTGVDELIVAAAIYDHEARLRSYELLADLTIGDRRALERGL